MFTAFSSRNLYPSDRPKWSDADGAARDDPDLTPLTDSTWVWEDEWHVEVVEGVTDPDGWQYAFNFVFSEWVPSPKRKCHVRRQKWLRTRVKLTAAQLSQREALRSTASKRMSHAADNVPDLARSQLGEGVLLAAARQAADRNSLSPRPSVGSSNETGGRLRGGTSISMEEDLNEMAVMLGRSEDEKAALNELISRLREDMEVLEQRLAEEEAVTGRLNAELKKKDTIIMQQTGALYKAKKRIKHLEHENKLAVKETEEMLAAMAAGGASEASSSGTVLISVTQWTNVVENGKKHVEYIIELSNGRSFRRRYSQFLALHEALQRTTVGKVLPPFPPKVLFGSPDLDRRLFGLDNYMRQISSHPNPEVESCIAFFLGVPSL